MAYKFQLGKAKLSGSIETAREITSQGGLTVAGAVALDAGQIDNAELAGGITNDKLVNKSVMFNGVTVALGATGSFGTDAVTEGLTNKYYLDSRARAAVSVTDAGGDGSLSYNSSSGVITYTGPSAAEARAHFSAVDAGGDGSFSYADGVFTYTGPSAAEARAHFSALTGAAYQNGNISYNSATGQVTLQPVEESWVRGRLGSSDFVTYDAASGVFSVSGGSFTGSARSAFSAGTNGGLIYNAASGKFAIDSYAAGDGLSLVSTGSLKVNVDASTIEINADALRVKDLGITNAKIADATIANGKLVNQSVSVVAGDGLVDGGSVSLGGSVTLNVAALSADAITVMPNGIDLKPTIAGNRTFSGDIIVGGNLTVNGSTTTVNSTELKVTDVLITVAKDQVGFAANQGLELGNYATLKTAVDADLGNALSSSLPMAMPSIKAGAFYGSFVGSTLLSIESKAVNATIGANVTKATANITLTLPSAPVSGQEHRVKCFVPDATGPSAPSVIVAAPAGATIEGVSQVVLESYGAALSLVWDGSMWMVF